MNQYIPTYISTATTTTIATGGQLTIHTISFAKATTGTVTLQDGAGSSIHVFPIGSIGSLILDCVVPAGLKVVTSAGDNVVVTTKVQ